MKSFSKWVSAIAVIGLLAGTVSAADAVSAGKIKGVNAPKKEFVLTDPAGKDVTIKLADDVVINRGGKETNSELKTGDPVNVCHDNGILTWKAHYILVQEGDNKNCTLVRGTVKSYDAGKKQLSFTDAQGKDVTYGMGDAKVQLNKAASTVENVKIGDHALAIVEKNGDKETLKSLMVERK